PGDAREGGDDARPSLGWSPRVRDRRRLEQARLPAAWDPVRRAEGSRRSYGGSGRPDQTSVDGGKGDARRAALPRSRRRGPATAHATSSPAFDDRRERSADAADRRARGADRRVRTLAESARSVDPWVDLRRVHREARRDVAPCATILRARA